MAAHHGITHKRVTLESGTTKTIRLPVSSKDHLLRLETDSDWRWSTNKAFADADQGFPLVAGESLSIAGFTVATDVHVRQNSGGQIILHWAYLYSRKG